MKGLLMILVAVACVCFCVPAAQAHGGGGIGFRGGVGQLRGGGFNNFRGGYGYRNNFRAFRAPIYAAPIFVPQPIVIPQPIIAGGYSALGVGAGCSQDYSAGLGLDAGYSGGYGVSSSLLYQGLASQQPVFFNQAPVYGYGAQFLGVHGGRQFIGGNRGRFVQRQRSGIIFGGRNVQRQRGGRGGGAAIIIRGGY